MSFLLAPLLRPTQTQASFGPLAIASQVLYAMALLLAFIDPLLSYVVLASVAVVWFVPDRRLARA
jgi:uncharacterized membrane protein